MSIETTIARCIGTAGGLSRAVRRTRRALTNVTRHPDLSLPLSIYRVAVPSGLGLPRYDQLRKEFPAGVADVYAGSTLWRQDRSRPWSTSARTLIVYVRDFHDPTEAPSLVEYTLDDANAWAREQELPLFPANQMELYALSANPLARFVEGGSRIIAPGAVGLGTDGSLVTPLLDLKLPRHPGWRIHPREARFLPGDRILYVVKGGIEAIRAHFG